MREGAPDVGVENGGEFSEGESVFILVDGKPTEGRVVEAGPDEIRVMYAPPHGPDDAVVMQMISFSSDELRDMNLGVHEAQEKESKVALENAGEFPVGKGVHVLNEGQLVDGTVVEVSADKIQVRYAPLHRPDEAVVLQTFVFSPDELRLMQSETYERYPIGKNVTVKRSPKSGGQLENGWTVIGLDKDGRVIASHPDVGTKRYSPQELDDLNPE